MPTSPSDPASSIGGPNVVPTIAQPTYVKPTHMPSEYAMERRMDMATTELVGAAWSGCLGVAAGWRPEDGADTGPAVRPSLAG